MQIADKYNFHYILHISTPILSNLGPETFRILVISPLRSQFWVKLELQQNWFIFSFYLIFSVNISVFRLLWNVPLSGCQVYHYERYYQLCVKPPQHHHQTIPVNCIIMLVRSVAAGWHLVFPNFNQTASISILSAHFMSWYHSVKECHMYISNISLSWICYWLGAGGIPATTETVLDRVEGGTEFNC